MFKCIKEKIVRIFTTWENNRVIPRLIERLRQMKKRRLSQEGSEDKMGVKNVTFKNCRRSRWRVTERSAIHTFLSIPANNSRSKAPVSTRWSLLIKGALITRLRDLIPGEGEEKRVSWGLGKEPTVVSPRSLPSKTLKVPANAKTASGENKHLGATTFWRRDSRRTEGRKETYGSMWVHHVYVRRCKRMRKMMKGIRREGKTAILKLSQYCAALELLAYDGNKIKEYA